MVAQTQIPRYAVDRQPDYSILGHSLIAVLYIYSISLVRKHGSCAYMDVDVPAIGPRVSGLRCTLLTKSQLFERFGFYSFYMHALHCYFIRMA